jgi:hypothetical protein
MPQVGGITAHLRIWRLNHLVHRTCEVTVTDDRPGPKDRSPGTFRAFRTPRFREDISGRGGGVRSCHSEGGHTAAAPDGSPGRDFRRAANYEKRACDAAVSGSPLASVSCRYPHSCQGRLLLRQRWPKSKSAPGPFVQQLRDTRATARIRSQRPRVAASSRDGPRP